MSNKSLTVRLPSALYEAAARVASKRRRSMNMLVQQGLECVIRAEEEREMYDAATLLAGDPLECDISYAFDAQSEVVIGND